MMISADRHHFLLAPERRHESLAGPHRREEPQLFLAEASASASRANSAPASPPLSNDGGCITSSISILIAGSSATAR